MIEFQQITKRYDQRKEPFFALNQVSLSIPDGSITGILGQSGAGKSTLLRLINGLVRPTSGKVLIDGQEIQQLKDAQLRPIRHQMSMIFQHFNLFATKTVYQNIAIALQAVGVPKDQHQKRITKVLNEVGLPHKIDSYPSQLSGGEKQRVGIARALITEPKYLLCDEITSALDPKSAKEILELLRRIHQERKLTIVFITHQIEAVMALCQEVILMEEGAVIHRSSTLDLFLHIDNPTTATYLKAVIYDVQIEHDNVYQLIYVGKILQEDSILSHMIRTFHVDVNIIHAKVLLIGEEHLGYLYLQIIGDKQSQAITYLREQGILVHALENQRFLEKKS